MEAIESIEREVKKFHHDGKEVHGQRLLTVASSPRPVLRGYNTKMVALEKDLEIKLMDQLVGAPSKVCVIPIVGMGGIGKTMLSRILFDSQLIKQSFDIRGWGTVSQTYSAREIVLGILEDIGVPLDGRQDIKQLLYQTLYDRKYLIVLDDVWNTQAWDDIKWAFPNNENGSRILLTTRHSQVAVYANSSGFYHEMQLLNEDASWSLLCQEIFLQNSCPPELIEIGKKIARQYHGLPLAISAIGGHLKKEKHTKEYWKYVSENVTSLLKTTDDPILEVLTLSYTYLPYHLKPCFLYLGSSKDHAIDVSEVLRLWIAEGFVRPRIRNEIHEEVLKTEKAWLTAFEMDKVEKMYKGCLADRNQERLRLMWSEMEEVAEEYLRFLIESNLVFVNKYDSFGKPKRFVIHDLFRDICTREAKKEKFHCLLDGNAVDVLDMNSQRRLTLVPNILLDNEPLFGDMVSRNDCSSTIILKISSAGTGPTKFPVEILKLVNLKYLQIGHVQEIPSSISSLRKLQTLIASSLYVKSLPSQIWEMQQLMHILIPGFLLPDIPDGQDKWIDPYYCERGYKSSVIIDFTDTRLVTLSEVIDFRCTRKVLRRVRNLKKLNIVNKRSFRSEKIANLQCLESLRCDFQFWSNDGFWKKIIFPLSLKKLVLIGCQIPWEQMANIGVLPGLEVLKLKVGAMKGKVWETNDGEFKQLRFLLIRYSDLTEWRTEKEHLPALRHLVLQLCNDLHVLPCEIGDIPTLERIELHKCSHALESSAKEIIGEDSDIKLTISNYEHCNVNA